MATQYTAPRNPYHVDGKKIVCDGDDINKVSGTAMAGILGCSPWSTPFTVSCNLLALAREDISNKDAVKVGIALEEKIIRYAGEKYADKGLFMTAEEVFEKREGDHDAWVSDFEDAHFAGHIDGIVSSEDGDYILEIKTSSNLDSWANGVPEYYFWQVALYNHFLTHKSKAYVVLGIVNEHTYRDPASWIPNENNVMMFELDLDVVMIAETIEKVREWYNENILKKTTTEADLDNPKDAEMYNHLVTIGSDIGEVQKLVSQLGEVSARIDTYDCKIQDLRAEEQTLKDKIKDYMVSNNLTQLQSVGNSYIAKVTSRTTQRIAEERLVADGIDPAKYKTTSTSKTFTIKKSKE